MAIGHEQVVVSYGGFPVTGYRPQMYRRELTNYISFPILIACSLLYFKLAESPPTDRDGICGFLHRFQSIPELALDQLCACPYSRFHQDSVGSHFDVDVNFCPGTLWQMDIIKRLQSLNRHLSAKVAFKSASATSLPSTKPPLKPQIPRQLIVVSISAPKVSGDNRLKRALSIDMK
jgi:hypothetical protein